MFQIFLVKRTNCYGKGGGSNLKKHTERAQLAIYGKMVVHIPGRVRWYDYTPPLLLSQVPPFSTSSLLVPHPQLFPTGWDQALKGGTCELLLLSPADAGMEAGNPKATNNPLLPCAVVSNCVGEPSSAEDSSGGWHACSQSAGDTWEGEGQGARVEGTYAPLPLSPAKPSFPNSHSLQCGVGAAPGPFSAPRPAEDSGSWGAGLSLPVPAPWSSPQCPTLIQATPCPTPSLG